MTYQAVCAECGLMHPPVPPGECTVAQGAQIEQSTQHLSSQKAARMMQAIQIKLLARLKELPAHQQDELTQMVFLLIDKYE